MKVYNRRIGGLPVKEFIPRKQEKEVISIRLDCELIKTVDHAASKVDISRNEFINQCIVYALEHLTPSEKA